jgi:predicted TIM-barrel fold metal-dependent hydrolase
LMAAPSLSEELKMTNSLPSAVLPYIGRLTDADSHEQMPAQVWVEHFGEVARPIAEIMMAKAPERNPNDPNVQGYPGDIREITPETLWTSKGPSAPGAVEPRRRLQVMDMMGIDRQLMFPTSVGLYGAMIYSAPVGSDMYKLAGEKSSSLGAEMMEVYNRWAIETAKISSRIRPVAALSGRTPSELLTNARHLVEGGIRAVMVMSGMLPGGVSPAHNDLDPFYAFLAEANVPMTLHIGTEFMFLSTLGWGQAKAFEGFRIFDEISLDPWRLSAMHLAPQNYIATMVTGGVFDRHPALRVGVLEYTAHWIGPLAEMLDLWHENNQSIEPSLFADGSYGRRLPLRPSEYINRNVRVAPFEFEPVGRYIEKYGLEDVYCFASDYPHVEGGKNPIGAFSASLEAHSHNEKVFEKFFVKNGELLLPA